MLSSHIWFDFTSPLPAQCLPNCLKRDLMTKKTKLHLPESIVAMLIALSAPLAAADLQIELPGDAVYPESLSASADGTLYGSSLASGGIWRVKPGAAKAEEWIKPGDFGSRSTFGVLVDEKKGLLWVCSNDASGIGVKGPGSATGSNFLGFDLVTGTGKVAASLPGSGNLCNDSAVGADGSVYATNSLKPQILRLAPGSSSFEVWLESPIFNQPKEGAGLDGIAFGADGNLYVDTFTNGEFFRVDVKDGKPGKITKLTPSRPIKLTDGLRPTGGQTFVMAEGAGTIDRVSINGDVLTVETVKDGLAGPTAVALVGGTLWAAEGQLSHLFDAKSGPPKLPFKVVGAPMK
jgi:sugar lactone lactonase YvrE